MGRGGSKTQRMSFRVGMDGALVPEDAPPSGQDEWDVTLEFDRGAELPFRLVIEPSWLAEGTFEAGITARLLHAIKLGALVDEFNRRERATAAGQDFFLGRRRPRPRRADRPRRSGWGEAFYQDVAAAYLEALQANPRRPIEHLAKRFPGYRLGNVRDWVAAARRRGYLSPTTQGRPGGQPTQKLLAALERRR